MVPCWVLSKCHPLEMDTAFPGLKAKGTDLDGFSVLHLHWIKKQEEAFGENIILHAGLDTLPQA